MSGGSRKQSLDKLNQFINPADAYHKQKRISIPQFFKLLF